MTTPTDDDRMRAAMDIGQERAEALKPPVARKLFTAAIAVRAVFAAGQAHKPGRPRAAAEAGVSQIVSDTAECLFGGINERAEKYSLERKEREEDPG